MEKIIAEKPDDASALNFIGYTLASSGKDIDRAERLVRKAAELRPDDGYIKDSLGWVLFKKGQTDAALQLLEEASSKVKSDPVIGEHLGDVLTSVGRQSQAVEAYRKSLQANPDNLIVQDKLRKLESELSGKK